MSEEIKEFPVAVDAPEGDVVPLTLTMVGELLALSQESPRKRMIQKIHKDHGSNVHKMFNAMQPGTYITPHRHMHPEKTETLLVVSGAILFVEFSDMGKMGTHTLLQPGTEIFGIDVAPHVYHTFIALKPDTLIFEIKDGPYEKSFDKDIPDWAPREGSVEAEQYLLDMLKELSARTNEAVAQAEATDFPQEGDVN